MALADLHTLPKVRDSWSYLYVEHCRIDQDERAIALWDAAGVTPVPCASLNLLMLGPGTNITHAAIRTLAENGCLVTWTGEEGVRFYAQGSGETRSARNLLAQVRAWSDPARRLEVVRRMYAMRFPEPLPQDLSLEQIRGREGIRVRSAYARASQETGVPWRGRNYDRGRWGAADPVNRALSAANSCLYGLCHAAIVAAGYSPALGFVHTGKMLSFVYDAGDLYKTETAVPVAFRAAEDSSEGLESRVRRACRDTFRETRLLARIVADLQDLLGAADDEAAGNAVDDDAALPGGLWDGPGSRIAQGGVNWSDGAGEATPAERGDG